MLAFGDIVFPSGDWWTPVAGSSRCRYLARLSCLDCHRPRSRLGVCCRSPASWAR